MVSRPLISVIMPAYNAERFIAAAIRSVLDQTYSHWELLVVDDASSDETPQQVARFTDPRIIYKRIERLGHPAGVRNTGIRMAKGDFFTFLDADDCYLPDALEKLSSILIANPAWTAVYGFPTHIDENGDSLIEQDLLIPKASGGYQLPPTYAHTWENIVTGRISHVLPGLMLRRSTVKRVGLFNEALFGPEDYEYYVRLFIDNFDGVYCLPDYVYQYRIHWASLTKSSANWMRILNSTTQILDWLFSKPELADQIGRYRSIAYVGHYRYYARERLVARQKHLCRRIAWMALQDSNIHGSDWLKQCLPLVIRSLLPAGFNDFLINLRRRRQVYRNYQP
jgi:glycosyltransferase involved in cell wall biosynthesis